MKILLSFANATRLHYLALGAILVFAFVLRIHDLGVKSLWYDEIHEVLVSRSGLLSSIQGATAHYGAAPLDYVVTGLTARSLGQSRRCVVPRLRIRPRPRQKA